jgi:hypothetical protein
MKELRYVVGDGMVNVGATSNKEHPKKNRGA